MKGVRYMKKLLSAFLSFAMLLSIVAPFNSVFADTRYDVLQASCDLAQMYKKDGAYKKELLSDSSKSVTVGKRIIVKSEDDNINTYDSVDSICAGGYVFAQYATEASASKAFAEFQKAGLSPAYDSITSVDGQYTNTKVRDKRYEWAYGACDIDDTLNYYKYRANREVIVGVIDSGIQYNIKVFKNRVIRTYADFSGDATGDEMDKFGHGTQVASTVAMCTPDNVKIEGFKVSNNQIITDSSVLLALSHIKEMKRKPDVINMSFSGTEMDSHIETEINELTDMGIVFVGSAGNDGREVKSYPAAYDNVIAVAATDKNNNPCDFSNFGNYVDIAAPGYYTAYSATSGSNAPNYTYYQGTSYSAPIVASAAAVVLSEHGGYTFEQVKSKLMSSAVPFREKDCNKKYGKGIVNFSNTVNNNRCKEIKANYSSGVYNERINVSLSCDNTLVDIIYTTDGTIPSKNNGNVYTAPIFITQDTRIIAAAYEKTDSVFHGKYFCADYYIGGSDYVIDDNGTLNAYLGNSKDVVIPDKADGITPLSVGENCFKFRDLNSITLPDSVAKISDYAFYDCNAKALTANGATDVGKYAFAHSGFSSVLLPNCKNSAEFSFDGANVQTVKLGKVTDLKKGVFKDCQNLQTLYCPSIVDCKSYVSNSFENCKSLKTLFAPKVNSMHIDIPSNVNLYVNNRLSLDYSIVGDYRYIFIAPLEIGINALRDFIEKHTPNSFSYKDSGGFANSKGAQIRAVDSGLRFGFNWSKMAELEDLADKVEYGFVVSYSDTDNLDVNNAHKRVKASKISQNGNQTDFNLVIKNIPPKQRNTVFSVRAYVNIDGLYFYSPIVKRSFNQVAMAVVNDEEVDDSTKAPFNDIIKEVRA